MRKLIQIVLTDVGKAHPQALVYPLTVASKYPSPPRRRAALAIIDRMAEHSAALVEQAKLVSQELIRVAILWNEMWHEGLEEASRLYYGDGNVEAMFATLDPLHDLLEKVSRIIFSLHDLSLLIHLLHIGSGNAARSCIPTAVRSRFA